VRREIVLLSFSPSRLPGSPSGFHFTGASGNAPNVYHVAMAARRHQTSRAIAVIAARTMASVAASGDALAGEAPPASAPAAQEQAASPAASNRAVELDRVVVRWTSIDTGGPDKPQFILARELGFGARLEALSDGYRGSDGYADKHVRSAIQRHVTETMLASLPLYTNPTRKQHDDEVKSTALYAEGARLILEQRVGGRERVLEAARAEGVVGDEIDAFLRRQARASLYLDRMVAPMLEPSEAELREVLLRGESPFTDRPFGEVQPQLRRWLVASRVAAALGRFYRNAQSRLLVRLIGR
jgi:hypothetical protein